MSFMRLRGLCSHGMGYPYYFCCHILNNEPCICMSVCVHTLVDVSLVLFTKDAIPQFIVSREFSLPPAPPLGVCVFCLGDRRVITRDMDS